MQRLISFIIHRRWIILGLVLSLTLAAGAVLPLGQVGSSIGGLILGEHPDYPRYIKQAKDFGNDDVIVVAVDDPAFLTEAGQARLGRATQALGKLPYIQQVRSVLDVQRVHGDDQGLDVRSYADLAREPGANLEQLRARLAADPFARGGFVSRDGRHTAVVVEMDTDRGRPAEGLPGLVKQIRAAFAAAGYAQQSVHVVGLSANVAAVMEAAYFNLKRLFPLVLLVLLVTVWIMFRRLWPVAITGVVALVAVTWTMAFAIMLDRTISIFTAIVPPVVLIVAFSDVVHLCSAYLLELGQGKSKREAILATGAEVGAACLFTSVTTFVGFISLSFVPTPASRQLGLVLGFGTATALLLALLLTPILMSLFPQPRAWRAGRSGVVQAALDRLLQGICSFTTTRPVLVVLAFGALLVLVGLGLSRLTIESDFARRMDHEHRLSQDTRYFKQHFTGTNSFHLSIKVPAGRTLLEPKLFARVAQLQADLQRLPEVDRVSSLVDLMQTLHGALNPGAPPGQRIPATRQALAQYLLLFEMSGGSDLDRLVAFSRRSMLLRVYLNSEEFRRNGEVGERVRAMASRALGAHAQVEVSGLAYLIGGFFNVILTEQKRALLGVFVLIAVVMCIGLRSLRVGLVSMLPNLLPLMVLGGYLGLCWDYVDSDILTVAMIGIGIGVDDTIHFLMRYRIESRRQPDPARALRRTFTYSGRGIVITTVILVLGFSPFALSDYLSIYILGSLLPMTLVVALLADLLLVPALAQLKVISFR